MSIYERYSNDELGMLGLTGTLPKHVGIIMDGNGRWAKAKHMPRSFGHRAGMDALHEIVRTSHSIGIEALTVYAFSTENWGRPKRRLMLFFRSWLSTFIRRLTSLTKTMSASSY